MDSIAIQEERPRHWRGYVLPAAAGIGPLIAAFLGALATGSGGGVVGGVEGLQSASSRLLDDFGTSLQLGFAFVAGMVATVNPCGFPMLPAYLGLYLGERDDGEQSRTVVRAGRGLLVGGVVTSGIVVLFGVVGAVVSGGARTVIDVMPWVGLTVGILLSLAGAWMLGGGKLYSGFAGRAASRIGDPTSVSVRGYFLFGLSYGLASLSCTLPIFLAVTGLSIASEGFFESAGQFFFYALGMGSVIVLLTVALSVFKGAMVGVLRGVLPYVQPASAVLMIVAGAYIVFYWLTLGDLIDKLT
ncbi:MAG: cytochrome c biogenesis protein CcdA [Chloroflexi bacterium]|nr:cytochrome c biogenesis protein CcdA [Chloroflexota bacterium]